MKIETNRLPGFRPNFARTTKHTADGEERTLHVELEGDWIRLTISVPEPSTLSWSGFRFPMKRDPLGETLLFTCEHLKKSGISPETTAAFLQLAMKKLRVPGLLQGRILADLDYLQVVAASERFQKALSDIRSESGSLSYLKKKSDEDLEQFIRSSAGLAAFWLENAITNATDIPGRRYLESARSDLGAALEAFQEWERRTSLSAHERMAELAAHHAASSR